MELRWDGIRSLADAMDMLRRQVAITPAPQWVRVIGGFTEQQFIEKRLPTIEEINAIAPDTPVFLLHLYDRALLNAAAIRAVGFTKDTKDPPGGEITRDAAGNPTGLLLAKPNAGILYATLAKGPKLPFDYQVNSTRHFMRELNRLGVTAVIDAGGGFQNYPDDYAVIQKLADEDLLTVRLAYNLFTQKPNEEKEDFLRWTSSVTYKQGTDYFRHNGAGEMLVFSAADFEDFRQPRPDMPPEMEGDLEEVVRVLAQNRWPGVCMQHMTRRFRARSTSSKRSTATHRSTGSTGSSIMRKQFPTVLSIGSRHSVAASPFSTEWPIRANTLLSDTGMVQQKRRRQLQRCWSAACTFRREPMRRGSPLIILGSHFPGWSQERPWAACSFTRDRTASTGKRRFACGPKRCNGSAMKRGARAA